jgi:hypothetical protein
LAGIAAAGGGEAGAPDSSGRVLGALSRDSVTHPGSSAIAGLEWRDLGRFLLAAAAIPLLLGFRTARP